MSPSDIALFWFGFLMTIQGNWLKKKTFIKSRMKSLHDSAIDVTRKLLELSMKTELTIAIIKSSFSKSSITIKDQKIDTHSSLGVVFFSRRHFVHIHSRSIL